MGERERGERRERERVTFGWVELCHLVPRGSTIKAAHMKKTCCCVNMMLAIILAGNLTGGDPSLRGVNRCMSPSRGQPAGTAVSTIPHTLAHSLSHTHTHFLSLSLSLPWRT